MLELKDLTTLRIAPERKIVRAAEYQACVEAQDIIDRARAAAARIIAQAEEQYARREQEGYEAGLLAGRMEMAEKMVDSVSQAVDYVSGLEQTVVDIVLKALRKILGEMDARDRVVQVVRSALAVARNQRNVVVRVSPAEADAVKSRLDDITRPYPGVHFLEVVADPRLAPGACLLESDIGVVDAGLEVQLAAIEKSLSKSMHGGAG